MSKRKRIASKEWEKRQRRFIQSLPIVKNAKKNKNEKQISEIVITDALTEDEKKDILNKQHDTQVEKHLKDAITNTTLNKQRDNPVEKQLKHAITNTQARLKAYLQNSSSKKLQDRLDKKMIRLMRLNHHAHQLLEKGKISQAEEEKLIERVEEADHLLHQLEWILNYI